MSDRKLLVDLLEKRFGKALYTEQGGKALKEAFNKLKYKGRYKFK